MKADPKEMEDDLLRLVKFGRCEIKEAEDYARSLRKMADEVYSRQELARAANFFKALSDPVRLKMVGMLLERELCACELKVALNLSQPTISYHINMLERAGILEREKTGRWILLRLKNGKVKEILTKVLKEK